jgi:hypothetical protein
VTVVAALVKVAKATGPEMANDKTTVHHNPPPHEADRREYDRVELRANLVKRAGRRSGRHG